MAGGRADASPRGEATGESPGDAYLITGASGFIGGHVAGRLAGEGIPVRCLVRQHSDTSLLDRLDVELAVGDLSDPGSLSAAVSGCRYVVHCGALVSDWASVKEISRVNVEGTRNLLAAAAKTVERFIHVSTTDVYGYPGEPAVDESHRPARFRNWYAQTKLAAEEEVRRAANRDGLDAVILRPATVYGPGSRDVIGEIARALRGGNMVLVRGGRAVAGLCYVENLVDAVLLALRTRAASGQAFNVSDGLDVTWRQLTDDLADGLGARRARWSLPYWAASGIGFVLEQGYRLVHRTTGLTTRPLLSRQAVHVMGLDQDFDNRNARELLGWEPRIGYREGLAATLAWLRQHGT